VTRKASIADLFSNEQREFYDEHAPAGLAIETLAVLGPIPILKVKMKPQGFGHKLVVEYGTPTTRRSSSCRRSQLPRRHSRSGRR
jgi:hypothetical protein